ncbi:MAG: leucyl aminopeptidase [bacterium]
MNKKILFIFIFTFINNVFCTLVENNLKNESEELNMIDIQIAPKRFWENDVEGYIFLLQENIEDSSEIEKIESEYYPNLREILKKHKFKGGKKDSFVLTATKNEKLIQLIFVGLGKVDGLWSTELENLRRAVGRAVKSIKKLEIESSVLDVPYLKELEVDIDEVVKQITVAGIMADYEFIKFKTAKDIKDWHGKLLLSVNDVDKKDCEKSLIEGIIIGRATNFTRSLADLPPNILTPAVLAQEAKNMAVELNLKCTIFGRAEAEKLGMGGFLAVDEGSDKEGKFVVLEYWCGKKDARTIALVGKGVTFDSGGVSLKPPANMTGMKYDMSGAAGVLGVIKAIAQIKPNVNVISVTPLVENMPSGKSSRQDDIITFMNGKTAEIQNTDAEGRLILADALCYAEKNYNPDVMIDVATLTAACVYALGHFFTGLMTKNKELEESLIESAMLTGDRVWPLPFDDDFKPAIESDVADIANTGKPNYKAGTVTAGWFLSNFVDKSKWAHLDIAGTSDGVPGIDYIDSKCSAGAAVRLLINFILNYEK